MGLNARDGGHCGVVHPPLPQPHRAQEGEDHCGRGRALGARESLGLLGAVSRLSLHHAPVAGCHLGLGCGGGQPRPACLRRWLTAATRSSRVCDRQGQRPRRPRAHPAYSALAASVAAAPPRVLGCDVRARRLHLHCFLGGCAGRRWRLRWRQGAGRPPRPRRVAGPPGPAVYSPAPLRRPRWLRPQWGAAPTGGAPASPSRSPLAAPRRARSLGRQASRAERWEGPPSARAEPEGEPPVTPDASALHSLPQWRGPQRGECHGPDGGPPGQPPWLSPGEGGAASIGPSR